MMTKNQRDFSDFHFEIMKPEEYEKYSSVIVEDLRISEPLAAGFHIPPDDYKRMYIQWLQEWTASGVSVAAIYVPTGEIAGFQMGQILTKANPKTYDPDNEITDLGPEMTNFIAFACHLEQSFDVFENPEIDKVLEITMMYVNTKFRGRGLATQLYKKSEKLGLEKGCQRISTQVTNKITQRMFAKNGYKVMFTLNFLDFEVNGQKVFDLSVTGGSTKAEVVIKDYIK